MANSRYRRRCRHQHSTETTSQTAVITRERDLSKQASEIVYKRIFNVWLVGWLVYGGGWSCCWMVFELLVGSGVILVCFNFDMNQV